MGDTIFALSSGSVPSGVAVVRVSGPQAFPICEKFFGRVPVPGRFSFGQLCSDTGDVIDEGLVLAFQGPRSFTGEDCVEFQVHGSRAVIEALFDSLRQFGGTRVAAAGEFTRRAFENGRLDLTEVEAISDLIDAETESQRRLALLRLQGGFSQRIGEWRERLLETLAVVESQIDFADEEDVGVEDRTAVINRLGVLRSEFVMLLSDYSRGQRMKDGVRVVLVGAPNAGKSSLINALTRSDVAIVTEEPGTTRDVKEVQMDLDGVKVVLVDVAGLRDAESLAEQEGVRRARLEIAAADVCVVLRAADGGEDLDLEFIDDRVLLVERLSKVDLIGGSFDRRETISSVRGDGIPELIEELSEIAGRLAGGEPVLVAQERDRRALDVAITQIDRCLMGQQPLELVAEDIRSLIQGLDRFVGRIDAEDMLGTLFSRFCIGK